MNNQDCNAVDYKPELRRSSRNKLSTSKKRERKVPTQNSVPFQTSVQKIDLSPKKKLPLITESPSPCQRQKSNGTNIHELLTQILVILGVDQHHFSLYYSVTNMYMYLFLLYLKLTKSGLGNRFPVNLRIWHCYRVVPIYVH